jgi:glycine/D-amino acid oxidase-like deaminating enzyme
MRRYVETDSVIVTNKSATNKFLPMLESSFVPVRREYVSAEEAAGLVERYGGFYIVLLDRSDSRFWRENARENEVFIESLDPPPSLLLDRRITPMDRLRIWRVTEITSDS